jgi:hypothetical protein
MKEEITYDDWFDMKKRYGAYTDDDFNFADMSGSIRKTPNIVKEKKEVLPRFDKDIYALRMGEFAIMTTFDEYGDEDGETSITRVPGGWLWGNTFVAYNDEFKSPQNNTEYKHSIFFYHLSWLFLLNKINQDERTYPRS